MLTQIQQTMEGIDAETVASSGTQPGTDQPRSGSPGLDPNQHTTSANHVTMDTSQSTILQANSSTSSGGTSLFTSMFNTAMQMNQEEDVATGDEILVTDEEGNTNRWTLSQYIEYIYATMRAGDTASDNNSNTRTMEGIDAETVASSGTQPGTDQPASGSPGLDPNQHTTSEQIM